MISFGQKKKRAALNPEFTVVTSVTDAEKAVAYFEDAIQYRKSEYDLSANHLNLAENYLLWCNEHGDKISQIRAKYYLFHYYNNHLDVSETLIRAEELIAMDAFLEMKESTFVLYILRLAYINSEQYAKTLALLPLSQRQIRIFGSAFASEDEDYNRYADEAFIDNYAFIHYKLKNYEQARFYFKAYAQYLKEEKNYYTLSSCLNNIGLCFLYEKKHDSAQFYFKNGINILNNKVIGHNTDVDPYYLIHFKNVINANIATVHISEQEYDKALPLEYNVLESSKVTREKHLQLKAYYDIAQIYYYRNRPKLALTYVDSTLNGFISYKNSQLRIKALRLKAKCFLVLGNTKMANHYFENETELIDSIEQEKVKNQFIQTTIELEVDDKAKQLATSKERLLEQEKVKLYQTIGLITFSFVLIGLYLGFKKNKKNTKIISQQKIIADRSLQEKEMLLKEMHHRVKNNLQLISSLLYFQSNKHKDAKFLQITKESQKQIDSIALIHEMLYRDGNIEQISMQNYVAELCDRLLQVSNSKQIEFNIETNNILLPINYATTIGLILNELITNTLKHAFKENHGEVNVILNKNSEGVYEFIYRDNGVGLEENFEANTNTFGTKLIRMFAEEIDANLNVENLNGLSYTFRFKIKV